jgi:hypothetical protein
MTGITINPGLVTNAAGTFSAKTTGWVQGVLLDDPAKRYELLSGIVGSGAPMWGGMAITESTTVGTAEAQEIGSTLALATSQANLTGFTVFSQGSAMVNSPQSPVPLAAANGAINFVRLGSGCRITVGISSANAAALAGVAVNTALYWDYTNQVLLTAPGGTAIVVTLVEAISSGCMTVVYNSGTGFATWNYSGACAVIRV